MPGKSVWDVFEAERESLIPYVSSFDGFHAFPAPVSKSCLIRLNRNRYSVDARAVGRPVEIRAYADRLESCQDGQISEKQARSIKYQMTIAKLPLAKELEEFDFEAGDVNETLIRELAKGDFLDLQRNLALIGDET